MYMERYSSRRLIDSFDASPSYGNKCEMLKDCVTYSTLNLHI